MTAPKDRRPMTDEEKDLANRLSFCRFLPGSWDKRFVRDMVLHVSLGEGITQQQAEWLAKTAYKFRVQLAEQAPELFG